MAGKTLIGSAAHERTIRWMKNEIQSLKNRLSQAGMGEISGDAYEPALGNPAADGYVLSSTMAGVRSWIASGGIGPDLTAIEALAGEGLAARIAADSWALREIAVSGNGLNPVTNPKGIAGNPTISLDIGTGAAQIAAGDHAHAGVYEPVLAAADPDPTLKYYRGDKTWATLNQAAVAGLTTTSGPTFDHLHITNDINGESLALIRLAGSLSSTQTCYSETLTHYPTLVFYKSHSNTATLVETLDTEDLGRIRFYGVNTTPAWAYGAYIRVVQDGAAGTYVPTKMMFITYNDTTYHYSLTLQKSGGVHVGGVTDVEDNALLVDGKFGCNGASVRGAYASGGAITPGAGSYGASSAANFAAMVTLVQNIRAALVANGIMS